MAKVGDYLIPFNTNGDQVHYPEDTFVHDGTAYRRVTCEMRPNEVFDDVLVFGSYNRGRSAAYFSLLRESNGKGVTMFLTDLNEAFNHFVCGRLKGKFQFVKRGQNYGVKLLEAQPIW